MGLPLLSLDLFLQREPFIERPSLNGPFSILGLFLWPCLPSILAFYLSSLLSYNVLGFRFDDDNHSPSLRGGMNLHFSDLSQLSQFWYSVESYNKCDLWYRVGKRVVPSLNEIASWLPLRFTQPRDHSLAGPCN